MATTERRRSPDIAEMKRQQTAHPRVVPGMLDAMHYYITERKPFREVINRFGVPKKAFERYVKDEQEKLTTYLDRYKPRQRWDRSGRGESEAQSSQYLSSWSDHMHSYSGDYGRGTPLLPPPGGARFQGMNSRNLMGVNYESKYAQRTAARFYMLCGMNETLQDVCKILVHIRYPDVYRRLGTEPPRGILLHGPPGCGKTLLAHAIAGEIGLPILKLVATELVTGISGDSEKKIRMLFDEAVAIAPTVLFLDNLDAVCTSRESSQRGMEKRIITQLISSLDDLNQRRTSNVLVVAATSHPEILDSSLRRSGRFDHEIALGIPDRSGRESILKTMCHNLNMSENIDYEKLALATPGFVGADLVALVKEAVSGRITKTFVDSEKQSRVSMLQDEVDYKKRQRARRKAEKEERARLRAEKQARAKAREEAKAEEERKAKEKAEEDKAKEENGEEEKNDVEMAEEAEKTNEEKKPVEEKMEEEEQDVDDKTEPEEEDEEDIEDINAEEVPVADFVTVFRWMKEQRVVREDQARKIVIQMSDFTEAVDKVIPSAMREGFITVPDTTWDDIGALKYVRSELTLSILTPVKYPKRFDALGLTKPAGILLAGPPGCGKTLVAKAIANECGINFISVKGPELLNMYVGESERAVRQLFERAKCSKPCVIFFDELDALCPRRSDFSEESVSGRVVNQLLTEMDGFDGREHVYIIAATNRPDILDPAVLRPGRLDKVLYIGLPTSEERLDILRTITKQGTVPAMASVSLDTIALDPRCEGFSGADMRALVQEASMIALNRYMEKVGGGKADPSLTVKVSPADFEAAFQNVKPSVHGEDYKIYEEMRVRYENKLASAASTPSASRGQKRSRPTSSDTPTTVISPTAATTVSSPTAIRGRRSGRKK